MKSTFRQGGQKSTSLLRQAQRVKYAVLNAPGLIPLYFKQPYNPMITKGILHKMLNRSIGIEIECFGSLLRELGTINFEDVSDYYGIMDYHEDNPDSTRDSQGFNECQIRISGYKQLIGLYNILEDLKKYNRVNDASGIHIHVNLADIITNYNHDIIRDTFKTYLQPRMKEINMLFHGVEENLSTYNHYEDIDWGKITQMIALRRGYKTIEFRTAPQTFHYSTIVKWLVTLNQMVNWTINKEPELVRLVKTRRPKVNEELEELDGEDPAESLTIDGQCICPICIQGHVTQNNQYTASSILFYKQLVNLGVPERLIRLRF